MIYLFPYLTFLRPLLLDILQSFMRHCVARISVTWQGSKTVVAWLFGYEAIWMVVWFVVLILIVVM